ncbi:MAG: hypothetical protein MUF34_32320, partial [Polyangiaceae bacterium]|nr:hypothetical protein [Polyangiaceae bacterium]
AGWAARNGITTVRQLIERRPDRLLREPNLGKTSVEETRRLVERYLGGPWESFASVEGPASTAAPGAAVAWDDLREFVPADARSTPLERLTLPARVLSFAARRSITTIGELIAIPFEAIKAERNFGRSSLDAVRDVVMGVWGDGTVAPRPAGEGAATGPSLPTVSIETWPGSLDRLAPAGEGAPEGFLEAWSRHLEGLSPAHRQALSARSGFGGPPSTLAQLGAELGVSRARAQQIEHVALRRLNARRAWFDALERRLELACPAGESVALTELAATPFWAGVASRPEALRYLLDHVLESGHHCFEFEGAFYLARRPGTEIEAAWDALYDELSALAYPVDLALVETIVDERTRGLGRGLREAFRANVRGELHVEEGDGGPPRSTAFGSSRALTILALLRASPKPLRVADLHARFGLGVLPDEVLFLGWGVVGLEQHVPDFHLWTDRVVPPTVAIMREAGDPSRQWSTAELIGPLAERVALPPWLDHWHLSSMLRVSGAVRYLGRLRVALEAHGERRKRVFIRDALEQVLVEAGQPLPHAELVRRARARAAMSPLAVCVTLRLAPFVRLDGGYWGLLYRDQAGRSEEPAALTLRSPNR